MRMCTYDFHDFDNSTKRVKEEMYDYGTNMLLSTRMAVKFKHTQDSCNENIRCSA